MWKIISSFFFFFVFIFTQQNVADRNRSCCRKLYYCYQCRRRNTLMLFIECRLNVKMAQFLLFRDRLGYFWNPQKHSKLPMFHLLLLLLCNHLGSIKRRVAISKVLKSNQGLALTLKRNYKIYLSHKQTLEV